MICRKCNQEKAEAKGRPNWCEDCHNAYKREWRLKRLDERRAYEREWSKGYRRRIRLETLRAYGGENPACQCCQESILEFLCIDHIAGGGNKDRQEKGKQGGGVWYSWLKKQGWPKGFRVLCHNCNSALAYYGYCPHQELVDG